MKPRLYIKCKTKKQGGFKMKKIKLVSSLILMFSLILVIVGCSMESANTDSYVTMDINPSIEMIVSAEEKVSYSGALNGDGEILLSNITLVDLDLDAAVDLVIKTSIELGFISTAAENVTVEVTAVSESDARSNSVRSRIIGYINASFREQAVIGRGEEKEHDPEVEDEAEEHGVRPGFLLLAKAAVYANDRLTLEVALEMEVSALLEIIKQNKELSQRVAYNLRQSYVSAKNEMYASFRVALAELEAQIEAANENKAALEAELTALITAHFQAMLELRAEFLVETQILRLQYQVEFHARKQFNLQAYVLFITQLETRKSLLMESIVAFQQGNS